MCLGMSLCVCKFMCVCVWLCVSVLINKPTFLFNVKFAEKGTNVKSVCHKFGVVLFTVLNRGCGKVMSTGGHSLRQTLPLGRHPPGRHPPGQTTPRQTTPRQTTSSPRSPLHRPVRILLENEDSSFLVKFMSFLSVLSYFIC